MSSIRQSIIYGKESAYGKGASVFLHPPPGSFFTSTHSRQATRIQSTGSKYWDAYAYGTLNGTWEWTFMLDYNYLEPLTLVFESVKSNGTTAMGSNSYTFSKLNSSRIPSFCVRRAIINTMANSYDTDVDEVVELRGCVCKTITFARSAGSSQVQVTMSGFYADEYMVTGSLEATDYSDYEGNLVEYACLFIGAYTDEDNYVANTESLSISIDNSAEAVFNTCTPFSKEYHEGITNYTFSTTAYSNDPRHYKERVYSGGKTQVLQPLSKGMAPVDLMHILSYNAELDRFGNDTSRDTHAEAYKASTLSMDIEITKCVIRSLQWQNGDGSKLQDSISSADCQQITMTFATTQSTLDFSTSNPHYVRDMVTPA